MTLTPPGQTAGVIQTLRFDAAWEIHQFRVSGGNLYAILGGLPCRGGENHDLRKTRRPGGYGLGESVSQGRG